MKLSTSSRFLSILIVSGFVFSSCSDNDLPEYWQLSRLRILAIKAEPPEVNPGTAVTLTPWVTDASGGNRSFSIQVQSCNDPGLQYGQEPTCEGSATVRDESSLSGQNISGLARTGTLPSFSIVPPSTMFLGKSTTERENGVSYLVTYTIRAEDNGEEFRSVVRIPVTSRTSGLNRNPSLTTFYLGSGNALTTLPNSRSSLSAAFSDQSREVVSGGLEEITLTWFSNSGDLLRSHTVNDQANSYTPPIDRPSDGVVIIAVARDGRGGVDVIRKDL